MILSKEVEAEIARRGGFAYLEQWHTHDAIIASAQDTIRKREREQQEAAERARLAALDDKELAAECDKLQRAHLELQNQVPALRDRMERTRELRLPELDLQGELTQLEVKVGEAATQAGSAARKSSRGSESRFVRSGVRHWPTRSSRTRSRV
jgi:hypothetical protein